MQHQCDANAHSNLFETCWLIAFYAILNVFPTLHVCKFWAPLVHAGNFETDSEPWMRGQTIDWSEKDTFVVPSWHEVVHEPDEDAVFFAFSDRPIQEKLGIFREQRGNH